MKKIYIVGIGPGDLCQMTNEAVSAIEESEAVVGYTKYIDLIKDLTANKKIYMSGMKQEKERCQKAIEFANDQLYQAEMQEFTEWQALFMSLLSNIRI